MKLSRVDTLTVSYLVVVSGLVIGFHDRVSQWARLPVLFAAYVFIIAALAWTAVRLPENRALRTLRLVYPLMALPFVYGSIEHYVLVLHGHFLDARMNAWEHGLFGVYPNVFLEHFVSRPLTEFMMACYFSFYFYVIVPALILMGQQRTTDLERFVFTVLVAFYACYLGFVLLPLVGPGLSLRSAFALPELQGYVFAPIQCFIMTHADPMGTCFPSSHVAVAWTSLLCIRRIFGTKVFWRILPFTIGLTVAVVYNRFHYLSDSIAGLAMAGLCYGSCARLFNRVDKSNPSAETGRSGREDGRALSTA